MEEHSKAHHKHIIVRGKQLFQEVLEVWLLYLLEFVRSKLLNDRKNVFFKISVIRIHSLLGGISINAAELTDNSSCKGVIGWHKHWRPLSLKSTGDIYCSFVATIAEF